MAVDTVVLVDELGHDVLDSNGRLATMEKAKVHRLGLLHRAVSVFIFNDVNEFLLQKRSGNKYHYPNKWSNTCCAHSFPQEVPLVTAQRRLGEEMGLHVALNEVGALSYRLDAGNGIIENEFDHVFFGFSNQDPRPDWAEVSDWRWVPIEAIESELARVPQKYSFWFGYIFRWLSRHKAYPR